MNAVLALVLIGGWVAAAYGLSVLVLPGRGASLRLSATMVFYLWVTVVVFLVLSPVHLFRLPVALLCSVGAAVLVYAPAKRRRKVAAQGRDDLRSARRLWGHLQWPPRVLLVAGLLFLVLVGSRSLVSPPLAWDDLVYHLFKSGLWVNEGGFTSVPAPDPWTYYDYYSATGEVYWSWFLLPARSGTFLGLGAIAQWLAMLVGGYAVARKLDADPNRAVVAGLAVVSIPACAVFLESSYVDNLEVLGFVLGFAFLLECRKTFHWWSAFLGLAGMAYAAGTKQSAAPFFAMAVIWVGSMVYRQIRSSAGESEVEGTSGPAPEPSAPSSAATGDREVFADPVVEPSGTVALFPARLTGSSRSTARTAGLFVAVALAASVVAAPWYLRSLADTGSPYYPLPLSLPGVHLAGNEKLETVLHAHGPELPSIPLTAERVWSDVLLVHDILRNNADQLNWGPFPLAWMILSAVGAVYAFVARRFRGPTVFLLIVLAAAFVEAVSPETLGLRTAWANVLGRLLLPAFAAMVFLAVMVPLRAIRTLMEVMVAAQFIVSASTVLRSWGTVDRMSLLSWLGGAWPWLLVAAACVGLLVMSRTRPQLGIDKRFSTAAVAIGALAVLLALGPPLESTREQQRYPIYQASASEQTYRLHKLIFIMCPNGLWKLADQPEGQTIAIVGGPASPLRFPFLGSNLQNRVVYVPFTSDGGLIENPTSPGAAALLDEQAWLGRLKAEDVDLFVATANSAEKAAIDRHPEIFKPQADVCFGTQLYKVDPSKITAPAR